MMNISRVKFGIDNIVDLIIQDGETIEGVYDILDRLTRLDWNYEIGIREQNDTLYTCNQCGCSYLETDHLYGNRETSAWSFCCPDCIISYLDRVHGRCVICNAFGLGNNVEGKGLCGVHFKELTARHFTEYRRLTTHLSRARKLNTPATLSLLEWVETLSHFGMKCAYCQSRPFQCLEHFIPLSAGGGTTQSNCVPSCNQCNNAKTNRDVIRDGIPGVSALQIANVVKYLDQYKV